MKKWFLSVILLAFLSSGPIPAKNLTQLNRLTPSNFELLDVEIEGQKMIIPGGLGGAVLFDISQPLQPTSIAIMRVPTFRFGRTYKWDLTDDIAIGTGREQGMVIFDIATRTGPQRLKTHDPNDDPISEPSLGIVSLEDVEIKGDFALFAAHSYGLLIYDISDPAFPSYVTTLPTTNAVSLAIHENVVFVADGDGGLRVIDISDIYNPVLIASRTTSGSTRDVRYADGYVFLAAGAAGVDVFDVSDPWATRLVANHPTSGFASRVAVKGELVAVSAWNRLEVFRWDGSALELVGYKNTGHRVMAVGMPEADLIYSAEWETLRIFEFGPIAEADIDLSTREINYPQLEIGESDTARLDIENNGGTALEILAYGITSTDFSVAPKVTLLEPGDTAAVQVIYHATSSRGGGTMEIVSNDPDEGSVTVTLKGNSTRSVSVGQPAAQFELQVIANGVGTLSMEKLRGKIVVLALFASW